jgi:hypothetical protein
MFDRAGGRHGGAEVTREFKLEAVRHDVLTAALLSIEKEPQAARVASHIVER